MTDSGDGGEGGGDELPCATDGERVRIELWSQVASLNVGVTQGSVVRCTADWMRSNRFNLNPMKTELLWSITSRRHHALPQQQLRVDTRYISPSSIVRNLGINVDSGVSLRSHVATTVSACFAVLRHLQGLSAYRYVTRPFVQSLWRLKTRLWLPAFRPTACSGSCSP